ncbi:MAG: D-alanine aminotransferase [Gammaproteobacteria bacterium]|nr:D-alanine aminotransferase [Gammaproteobacteria bacterium]
MSRIVYVNGEYLPEEEGRISIFDRGFLFADGVYEVSAVLKGRLVDNQAHLIRLHRSLTELNIPQPLSDDDIIAAQNRLITQNNLEEGMVYLQITRGPADRDFAFPDNPEPTVILFTQQHALIDSPLVERGITIRTVEDMRWKRRDIKTVGLLAPSMAKQIALEAGADDAWMVEDGYVTEGTSNNAFIITHDNVVRTRQLSNLILHGITRAAILRLAQREPITIEETPFTREDAYGAKEAFITSATAFALSVVEIDGHSIGDAKPGPLVRRLRELYIDTALGE